MARRYAILDDNQRHLEARLEALARELPGLISPRACAAVVIGSVAEGRARDRSDLDLAVVLKEGTPRRSDYRWWDREVAGHLEDGAETRFPVQPVILARESLTTDEPHLQCALDAGIVLWDPEALLAGRGCR
jgi:hypothetical protein